jgi:hypothetical protein
MSDSATLIRNDVSPEVATLLRAGAAEHLGIVCRPDQIEKNWKALTEAKRLGYVRFPDIFHPMITDDGRIAIGAPSQAEVDRAKLILLCARARKPLVPAKRDDPRTDFDYRSYKACGYACTLLVKQPDARENPETLRVGRTLMSEPRFLGPRNSIVQPESEGRFVLAVMPEWLIKRAELSTYPFPIDRTDPAFTDDECLIWERLRNVCVAVNSRIRNAGKSGPVKYRFGESA